MITSPLSFISLTLLLLYMYCNRFTSPLKLIPRNILWFQLVIYFATQHTYKLQLTYQNGQHNNKYKIKTSEKNFRMILNSQAKVILKRKKCLVYHPNPELIDINVLERFFFTLQNLNVK